MKSTHNLIITNSESTSPYKYIKVKCTICNIYGFYDPLETNPLSFKNIYVYNTINGLKNERTLYISEITCEEFIIKSVIE